MLAATDVSVTQAQAADLFRWKPELPQGLLFSAEVLDLCRKKLTRRIILRKSNSSTSVDTKYGVLAKFLISQNKK